MNLKLKLFISVAVAIGTISLSQQVSSQQSSILESCTDISCYEVKPPYIYRTSTAVIFSNNTDRLVDVETFNENDGLRWVAYQKTKIPAKTSRYVSAQGNNIQIVVDRNRSNIHRCQKGQYCAWDGQTLVAK